MTAVSDFSDLDAATIRAVGRYLDAVDVQLSGVDAQIAEETRVELLAHILAELEPDATSEDVAVLTGRLGDPEAYGSDGVGAVVRRERAREGLARRDHRLRGVLVGDVGKRLGPDALHRVWRPDFLVVAAGRDPAVCCRALRGPSVACQSRQISRAES